MRTFFRFPFFVSCCEVETVSNMLVVCSDISLYCTSQFVSSPSVSLQICIMYVWVSICLFQFFFGTKHDLVGKKSVKADRLLVHFCCICFGS